MPDHASKLPVTCILLAGGKGTRLAGLYPELPKPLVPVAGHPFLHWVVLWAQKQGIENFVFSTGHLAKKIDEWLTSSTLIKNKYWKTVPEEKPLGTGGGACACLPYCQEIILVTNGDSLIVTPLRKVIEHFISHLEIDALIVGKSVNDASRYASLEVNRNERLISYQEKVPGQGLISAGVYLFRRHLLEQFTINQPLSMEYDIIPKLLADGAKILVHRTPEETPFLDIGTPETVALADAFISESFKE